MPNYNKDTKEYQVLLADVHEMIKAKYGVDEQFTVMNRKIEKAVKIFRTVNMNLAKYLNRSLYNYMVESEFLAYDLHIKPLLDYYSKEKTKTETPKLTEISAVFIAALTCVFEEREAARPKKSNAKKIGINTLNDEIVFEIEPLIGQFSQAIIGVREGFFDKKFEVATNNIKNENCHTSKRYKQEAEKYKKICEEIDEEFYSSSPILTNLMSVLVRTICAAQDIKEYRDIRKKKFDELALKLMLIPLDKKEDILLSLEERVNTALEEAQIVIDGLEKVLVNPPRSAEKDYGYAREYKFNKIEQKVFLEKEAAKG